MVQSMFVAVACVFLILTTDVISSQRVGANVQYRPDTCLVGEKHNERPHPEPEDERYQACHQWKDGACCTPEFTEQLAVHTTVNSIDGFHWSRCGNFSQRCRKFFIEIECFYRCSPNIAHFALTQYPSALANLPICSDYCDSWYEACKDEMTCAINWVTDWMVNETTGDNQCRNETCHMYSNVYQSGHGICQKLWGESFFYSNSTSRDPDSTRQCLVPYFSPNGTNPNTVVIQKFFRDEINGGALPTTSIILMIALVVIIMTIFL